MPGQYKVTFKNFTYLDFSTAKKINVPKPKGNLPGEETLVRAGMSAIGAVSSKGGVMTSMLAVATSPVATLTVAGAVTGALIKSPAPDFTVTFGLAAQAGGGTTAGIGAGVYAWNKSPMGQVGLYGSVSLGYVTNVGVSVGDQICLLFGTPSSTLAGDSISLAVEMGIGVLTVSGIMILNAPPVTIWPPSLSIAGWTPQIIGVGFALSAGISALPADISVMPGRTWIKPVTP